MAISTAKHAELELHRLRDENTRLRKALRINGRHGRRIQRAYDAAMVLAVWHVAYAGVSRLDCTARGMSQRQWENATALLRLARVLDGSRWRVHDLAAIEERLRAAQDRACEAPEAFFARLPRH